MVFGIVFIVGIHIHSGNSAAAKTQNVSIIGYSYDSYKRAYDNICKVNKEDEHDKTEKVEKTVDFFLSGGAPYEFRTTLIKEYHDFSNIISIANWIKGAKKYFLQKFKDSGTCIKSHLSAVDDKIALSFRDILKDYISFVGLRGYDI
jgi:hypothetical protein